MRTPLRRLARDQYVLLAGARATEEFAGTVGAELLAGESAPALSEHWDPETPREYG